MPFSEQNYCFTRLFHLPRFRDGRLFHTWAPTLFAYAETTTAPRRDASAVFSEALLANTLILHTVIIANQAKPHVPVDRVLNLHNGRDMAAGPRHSAMLLPSLVAKKSWYRQKSYGFTRWIYESLPATQEVPVRNIPRSMRWQPFFLLFLHTNRAIPVPTSRTAIRTTTPFSRLLTFTPSNDPLPRFFQLS